MANNFKVLLKGVNVELVRKVKFGAAYPSFSRELGFSMQTANVIHPVQRCVMAGLPWAPSL